jgi:hypothetical protein
VKRLSLLLDFCPIRFMASSPSFFIDRPNEQTLLFQIVRWRMDWLEYQNVQKQGMYQILLCQGLEQQERSRSELLQNKRWYKPRFSPWSFDNPHGKMSKIPREIFCNKTIKKRDRVCVKGIHRLGLINSLPRTVVLLLNALYC